MSENCLLLLETTSPPPHTLELVPEPNKKALCILIYSAELFLNVVIMRLNMYLMEIGQSEIAVS